MTIKQSAIDVLKSHKKSMFIVEIWEEIISKEYYHFGAKDSLSVLKIEIARSCDNMEYSKPASIKHFHKEINGKFSLLKD